MDHASRTVVAIVPLVCVVYFAVSRYLNRNVAVKRDSANSLVVLSAMVASLAILIPLGATLLPEMQFGWSGTLLVSALLTGVVSLFGTIYCMISLQGKAQFAPQDSPHIADWINATWFALGLLALSSVLVKTNPAKRINESGEATPAGFLVARELPPADATRQEIEGLWGKPAHDDESELVYRMARGTVSFCIEAGKLTRSIIESKEMEPDALKSRCK